MTLRVSRVLQLLIAASVAVGIILVLLVGYGPDIDGRTPSPADTIQAAAIGSAVILVFALSAIALFWWHRLGWWLSVVLDGLLGLASVSMMIGDFTDRYVATQEGRDAFRGDLAIHGIILLLCMGAFELLLLARKRFLTNAAN